ncbi:MAG: Bax inhibitor-1/YccA family protein [Bacteroidales bacterium]|nr:Bax inhibitor-1/YccA family protein [Bacteroidales bacterium]
MNFTNTSNPAFSESRFTEAMQQFAGTGEMTMKGTATKTLLLFALVVLTGSISWKLAMSGSSVVFPLMIAGSIGSLICAIICCTKQDKAHIVAPIYALCEGLMLGAISSMFNAAYSGIVFSAILLTIAISGVVFLCYRFGILRASNTFVKIISFATMGICAFYLISMLLRLFGIHLNVFEMGAVGLVIQLVIVAIAALNLVLDFNTIEKGINSGAPAQFEWYAAFGLMVTLVWIYIEILRLLVIIAGKSRD